MMNLASGLFRIRWMEESCLDFTAYCERTGMSCGDESYLNRINISSPSATPHGQAKANKRHRQIFVTCLRCGSQVLIIFHRFLILLKIQASKTKWIEWFLWRYYCAQPNAVVSRHFLSAVHMSEVSNLRPAKQNHAARSLFINF